MKIGWLLYILFLLEATYLNAETCKIFQDTIPEVKEPVEDDTTFINTFFELFMEDVGDQSTVIEHHQPLAVVFGLDDGLFEGFLDTLPDRLTDRARLSARCISPGWWRRSGTYFR